MSICGELTLCPTQRADGRLWSEQGVILHTHILLIEIYQIRWHWSLSWHSCWNEQQPKKTNVYFSLSSPLPAWRNKSSLHSLIFKIVVSIWLTQSGLSAHSVRTRGVSPASVCAGISVFLLWLALHPQAAWAYCAEHGDFSNSLVWGLSWCARNNYALSKFEPSSWQTYWARKGVPEKFDVLRWKWKKEEEKRYLHAHIQAKRRQLQDKKERKLQNMKRSTLWSLPVWGPDHCRILLHLTSADYHIAAQLSCKHRQW